MIVQLCGNKLTYRVKHGNDECSAQEELLNKEVADVQQIDNFTFLVLEADRHRVRILSLKAKSHKDVLESN